MNRPLIATTLFTAAAVVVLAQNLTGVEFKSKSGDFSIANISEQMFESDAAAKAIDFEFSGKPLRGRSDSQSASFESLAAKGQIRSGSGGTMYLLSATLSGGVTLRQNPGKPDEVILSSPAVTLKEAPNRLAMTATFSGSLSVSAKDPDAKITAGSGTVTLSGPAGQNRSLDQATLRGSVSVTVNSQGTTSLKTTGLLLNQRSASTVFQMANPFTIVRTAQDGTGRPVRVEFKGTSGNVTTPDITKASKGRPVTQASIQGPVTVTFDGKSKDGDDLHLVARGDRMTLDPAGKLLLTGNVSIEGGGLDYQSQGSGQTVYILLDETMKPTRYGAAGDPAKIDVKPNGGGR